MADLMRHTAVWEGTPGLPGYSQFYHSVSDPISQSAAQGGADIRAFFSDLVSLIPDGVTVTVDDTYQILNEATGVISSEGNSPGQEQVVTGVFVGGWSRQIGVLVEWRTAVYIDSRRLRGRTYLVPLGGVGDADGTLSTGELATINASLTNIVDSVEDFRVWHRPKGAVAGSSSSIVSGLVRDKAAILNSRMN